MEPREKSLLEALGIKDERSCANAIRAGGIGAVLLAAITAGFGVVYLIRPQAGWYGASLLADFMITAALAIFVLRKSRTASTVLVIYFVSTKTLQWVLTGFPKGWLISLMFLSVFLVAMLATYHWHAAYEKGNGIEA